jgi:hypothetical protein
MNADRIPQYWQRTATIMFFFQVSKRVHAGVVARLLDFRLHDGTSWDSQL